MAKIKYKEISFRDKTLRLISLINAVGEEYQAKHYALTVRQMYYQLVARGYIENNQKSYKNVGKTISDGRTAGLIDWDLIVDRIRGVRTLRHFNSPVDALEELAGGYRLDRWRNQPVYVETWVEKDALIDVVGRACNELDAPFTSDRGYTSTTAVRDAANRFRQHKEWLGQKCYLLYLGDHDPSGVDMTRDISERLAFFGAVAEIRRIALTMEQIRKYNPPPAFAKSGDSRSQKYITEHGLQTWELDALDPEVLHNLIQSEISALMDVAHYNDILEQENEDIENLMVMASNYQMLFSE